MTKQIMREIDWYEGVFLRPHHFQYQDGRLKSQYRSLRETYCPYFWGVDRVLWNEQSMAAGVIAAKQLSFRSYEGVDIEVGRNAVLESRDIQHHLSEMDTVSLLYVGIRKIKPDFDNIVDIEDSSSLSLFEMPRFVRQHNVESVYDMSVKNSREDIGFLTYKLQYFLPFELDQASEFDLLPVARIRKINSRVVLDSSYLPPVYNVLSHTKLVKLLNDSVNDCAAFVDDNSLGNIKESSDHVDVLKRQFICQALVSYISSVAIQRVNENVSPYFVWSELKRLLYGLSSYSDTTKLVDLLSTSGSKGGYEHLDIVNSISRLLGEIRVLLKELDGKLDYQVAMQFDGTYFVASIDRTRVASMTSMYLLVKTSLPSDYVREVILNNIKIASKLSLPLLVSRSLSGISMREVDCKKENLLQRENSQYVRLDRESEHWESILKDENMSIYVDSVPSDIHFELVGVV